MSGTTTPRFLSLDHKKDGGYVEIVEFFLLFSLYSSMQYRLPLHGFWTKIYMVTWELVL